MTRLPPPDGGEARVPSVLENAARTDTPAGWSPHGRRPRQAVSVGWDGGPPGDIPPAGPIWPAKGRTADMPELQGEEPDELPPVGMIDEEEDDLGDDEDD